MAIVVTVVNAGPDDVLAASWVSRSCGAFSMISRIRSFDLALAQGHALQTAFGKIPITLLSGAARGEVVAERSHHQRLKLGSGNTADRSLFFSRLEIPEAGVSESCKYRASDGQG